ncbi:hypothetical protein ACIQC9_14670 [Brevundimonas sp. NPDC092305]|uniref:hypothetical protein n=1 Tax=Brevundimonas sp. NPDC092305 TaxID=3363957 RepID=UPI00381BB0FF
MKTLSLMLAAALTLAATNAAAQARTPTMPSATTTNSAPSNFNANNGFRDTRDFERNRADMTREREQAAAANPERAALADRIAALVQEGKCNEARTAANEAGDRQMALRVRQTCRAR